jgi:inorganic triphosphatase YgiF
MRKETELKFQMTPRDLRKLRGARVLRRKPLKEENLVSVYFDTPKHTPARNDVTLRGAALSFARFDVCSR